MRVCRCSERSDGITSVQFVVLAACYYRQVGPDRLANGDSKTNVFNIALFSLGWLPRHRTARHRAPLKLAAQIHDLPALVPRQSPAPRRGWWCCAQLGPDRVAHREPEHHLDAAGPPDRRL